MEKTLRRPESLTYHHFTVVDNGRKLIRTEPAVCVRKPRWATNVSRADCRWKERETADPCFREPVPFVIPPPAGSGEPFYSHNHCPALTWCDNGDLLAAWFSTIRERGTEMTILAARLRAGAAEWDPSAEFFKSAGRNMTGTALFNDGAGTLHHFNGVGEEGVEGFKDLLLLLRTSRDNGVTWTAPRPISSGGCYRRRHQVVAGTSVTPDGLWLQPCDAAPGPDGSTAIHISRDRGATWCDPGGDIRGIHAGVAGLKDGRLLALGRGQNMEGRMPMSISTDTGRTWTSRPSPFSPLNFTQRLVLMRLREGPLLFVSFTDPTRIPREEWRGMDFTDRQGKTFTGYGIFGALSLDEGETWPVRKLFLSEGSRNRRSGSEAFPEGGPVTGEIRGYLAAAQTPDGTIHLVSSRRYYRFNLAWLREPAPALTSAGQGINR